MLDFLIILGPTATGKTNFAVKVSEKFNGEIPRKNDEGYGLFRTFLYGAAPRKKESNC